MMMIAPLARESVRIECPNVRPAFVEMTAGIMRQWGGILAGNPSEGYDFRASQVYNVPQSGRFAIEPDVTAASYFMMLPKVVGGSLEIQGFRQNMLQGDSAFTSVLRKLGLSIDQTQEGWMVSDADTPALDHPRFDFTSFSDTFLTLAAVAPLFPFPVTISGIGHTRFQETDRIHAMAHELKKLGATVEERESSLEIHPFAGRAAGEPPVVVDTYKDHRVAMSFAVLGCSSRFGEGDPWVSIADPSCCGKTFPGFFEELEKLYRFSHDK
jgi:3-phosphoshikimate 1-carboxyvinyltransferase